MDLIAASDGILELISRFFGLTVLDVQTACWTIFVGIVCNVSCAVLGCFLVLRRMSLLGDAISHAILPGLAIAFLISGTLSGIPMFLGALSFGLLTAFLTQALSRYGGVSEDAGMGIVFTSLFAVGVVVIKQFADRVHLDADCVLYGLIEFVTFDTVVYAGIEIPRALLTQVPVLCVTVLFIIAFWKELKISSFDSQLSSAMGIHSGLIHYLLMAMVASVTVSAFQAVGSILVIAMLIVPGATAHLLTDRLDRMLLWSAVVGILSAVLGYMGAVWLNTSVAGMMAVVAGMLFTLAVFAAPRHGILSRTVGNLRIALQIVSEDIVAMMFRLEESQPQTETEYQASKLECYEWAGGGLLAKCALPLMQSKGILRSAKNSTFQLTENGRILGRSLVRSHRLWETFLDENFDLPADHLHEPASRIEHFIGPRLQERLAQEVINSERDPHGKTIPEPEGN